MSDKERRGLLFPLHEPGLPYLPGCIKLAELPYLTGCTKLVADPEPADEADDEGPNICSGCYALPGDPHAGFCVDAAIEAQREEGRLSASVLDEEDDDDDA